MSEAWAYGVMKVQGAPDAVAGISLGLLGVVVLALALGALLGRLFR